MILWFAGGAALVLWVVLHDPWLDYRVLVAGALIPDVVDIAFGGTGPLHALAAPVVLLCVVMLATRGPDKRTTRKRLLALPIGMFVHLLLDGVWTSTDVFWWPFSGTELAGAPLPWTNRPVVVLALQELAGLVMGWLAFGYVQHARNPEEVS